MRKRFTASIYVRHVSEYGKVCILLAHHKRFNMWVPVGGELNVDETPAEGALRELREETGLDDLTTDHLRYMGYEEHHAGVRGIHMNFSFLYDAPHGDVQQCDEHNELKWFEMPQWPDDMPSNVYLYLSQIHGGLYG